MVTISLGELVPSKSLFELPQQPQTLAADFVEHGLGGGQGVPGGEDVRTQAAEAVKVLDPEIDVARMGQDDQGGLRSAQRQRGRDQGGRRIPGAVDRGRSATLQRIENRREPFRCFQQAQASRGGRRVP